MTYQNNRANLFECNGHKILLNIEQSKIGYSYPRLFIEASNGEHINFDLTVGQLFGMSQKNWDDWMTDCETITIEEAKEVLSYFLDFDSFAQLIETL